MAFKQNQSFPPVWCFFFFLLRFEAEEDAEQPFQVFCVWQAFVEEVLSSRPVKMNNFYHCLEKKHLQPRTQTNHLSLSAAFIMLQTVICL